VGSGNEIAGDAFSIIISVAKWIRIYYVTSIHNSSLYTEHGFLFFRSYTMISNFGSSQARAKLFSGLLRVVAVKELRFSFIIFFLENSYYHEN